MEVGQLRILFLYGFKLDYKATDAARNINTAFGDDTANEQ
ncbi:hypothetical protein JGG64_23645, partial [Salmonella enterica subsp. enterica serovar Derby]|nr:hypothetical protein [Salmonella enterica subsp. enterica serovar Derby]